MDQQPVSDDQELAKVLAGVTEQANEAAAPVNEPASGLPQLPIPDDLGVDPSADADATATPDEPTTTVAPEPALTTPTPAASNADSGDLDGIKVEALNELRPLMDKLNVSAEEKYDIYLLLLRSTDDRALIAPAHEAAKAIEDETRRAQALLDIIKEIDFLSGNGQNPAAPAA